MACGVLHRDMNRDSMNPVWLLVVAAAGLLYVRTGSAPPITPTALSARAASRPKTEPAPLDVPPGDYVRLLVILRDLASAQQLVPEVVIATVPAPGITQVGWLFDSYLDATLRAAEAAGFLLYRYTLPTAWSRAAQKDDRGGKDGAEGDSGRSRLKNLGLVVLVKRAPPARMLGLFLVGESPTSGIDGEAFQEALRQTRDWHRGRIRVLGPTFSGSIFSLGQAIDRWEGRHFRVVSGTATSRANRERLEGPRQGRVTFQATVLPDDVVQRALQDYLARSGVAFDKMAFLIESSTGYGQGLVESAGTDSTPRLLLEFPASLAQARNAYEREMPKKEQPGSDTPEGVRRILELSLEDRGNAPRDVVAPLTPMSAFSVDLLLSNILSTLAREDIRYVGLYATDTRDKLFLARKIHEYAPDIRLFTTESDLLYTHPDYLEYLQGTIVASTYPLTAKSQLWAVSHDAGAPRGDRRNTNRQLLLVRQFGSSGAEGVFNAALALLGERGKLEDYGSPCFRGRGGCPGTMRLRRQPPVWITAVGHGAMWPLAISSHDRHEPAGLVGHALAATSAPSKLDREPRSTVVLRGPPSYSPDPVAHDSIAHLRYPPPAKIGLLLVTLLSALHAVAVFLLWRRRDGPAPLPEWTLLDPFRPRIRNAGQQRWWVGGCLGTLLGAQLYLASLDLIFVAATPDLAEHWLHVAIALCCLVPCAGLLAALVRLGPERGVGKALGLGLAILGTASWLAWALPTFRFGPDAGSVFLWYRAANPGSGLSPALPVLCLATLLYLWCLHHLNRLLLLETAVPDPLASLPGDLGTGIREPEEQVRLAIENPLRTIPSGLCIALLGTSILLSLSIGRQLLPTFEGQWFDHAFAALLGFGYFVVLSGCLHLVCSWRALRRLLRRLAHHPLGGAFDRLPDGLRTELRRRFYAWVPSVSDRREAARPWLDLGGRYVEPFGFPWDSDDQEPPRDEFERDARGCHDPCAFFAVEVREAARRGHDVSGAGSAVQRCLSHWAVDFARVLAQTPDLSTASQRAPEPIRNLMQRAEEFVAVQVAASLGSKFASLKSLAAFVVAGTLLVALVIASYPFQPQRLLTIDVWLLAGVAIVSILVVLVQVDRDPLLSRLSATPAGRLTFDYGFLRHALTYGVLPIATVIATQFPETGRAFDALFKLLR